MWRQGDSCSLATGLRDGSHRTGDSARLGPTKTRINLTFRQVKPPLRAQEVHLRRLDTPWLLFVTLVGESGFFNNFIAECFALYTKKKLLQTENQLSQVSGFRRPGLMGKKKPSLDRAH